MESSHLLLEKPGPQADLTLRKLLTVLAPLADVDNISVASPILTLLVSVGLLLTMTALLAMNLSVILNMVPNGRSLIVSLSWASSNHSFHSPLWYVSPV